MAQQRRKGYRVAKNYEPGRKPNARKGAGRRGASGGAPSGGSGRTGERAHPDERSRVRADAPSGAQPSGERRRDADASGSAGRRAAPRDRSAPGSRIPATVTTAEEARGRSFAELGLGANIVRELAALGADRPFPIQVATIPDALRGRDVLGRARTGSGKTIAFGAAVVERLLRLKAEGAFGVSAPVERPKRGVRAVRRPRRNPKALILAPTRELALQIDRTVQPLARAVGLYTAQLVGGVPVDPQVHALERGIDIVIGTPGRIRDLVERRKLDLREVRVSVIDEADHLCDLGFLETTQWALRQTARGGQRLLYSATLDSDVNALVDEFLRDPAAHEVEESAGEGSRHRVLIVLREQKDAAVRQLLDRPGRVIAFCRTRAYAERLTGMLAEAGMSVVPLHGDLKQSVRERNLAAFSRGKASVLVATDVAARGIHVDDVDLVVQVDPPDDAKAYLHRAGRTGRAGAAGEVVTLIPRTRQQRTRAIFDEIGIEPEFFGDFQPRASRPNE